MPKVPKNGTYIRGQSTGDVYTIAYGAPIHVASWAGVGGEKPTIGVDDAAIDNAGHGGVWRFLKAVPTGGFIRGATSYRIYHVVNGRPYYVSSWNPFGGEKPAVSVHDASIDTCNHLNCDPWGALDGVTGGKALLSVAGWAQDPNTTSPVELHVYVDGVMAASAKTDRARPDIDAKYHRGLNYGYKTTVAAKPGKREVCVYAINTGVGKNNTHLGCKTVTVAALSTFTSQPIPTISGITRVDETLHVTTGTWKPSAKVAVQWKVNGSPVAGATGAQLKLTAAMAGKKVTVTTTAVLTGYSTASKTSVASAAVSPLSAYSTAPTPTIAGIARVGSVLTGKAGAWKPAATTVTVAWLRDGRPIAGATSSTYVLVAADMGKKITFAVTSGTRGYIKTTKVSTATGPVVGLSLTAAPVPTVTGKVAIGQTMTAVAGTWAPAGVNLQYQWLRNGVTITGATNAAYVISAGDVNTALSVMVTGTKSGYAAEAKTSRATGKVPALEFAAAPPPTISGTTRVTQTLTASVPGWTPAPTSTTYQWKRGSTVIPGATGRRYILSASDAGQAITVTVTNAKLGFSSVTTTSAPTAPIALATLSASPIPGISGTPKVGQALTVATSAWTPAPVMLGYQWNRNGKPIAGATRVSYTPVAADKGAALTVTVSGSKAGYSTIGKTSAAVKPQ